MAPGGKRGEAPVFTDQGLCMLAPRTRQTTNRHSGTEPQVWFWIIHVAADGHHRALPASHHLLVEQWVLRVLRRPGAWPVSHKYLSIRVFRNGWWAD